MFVTSLGESVVCSAMVVYFVSGPLQQSDEGEPLMSDAKNEYGAFDWCGGLPKNPSGPTAIACF